MVKKSIRVRNKGTQAAPAYWVICHGEGDGNIFEYYCSDGLRPIPILKEAEHAARFVASHYINEDGSPVEVVIEVPKANAASDDAVIEVAPDETEE